MKKLSIVALSLLTLTAAATASAEPAGTAAKPQVGGVVKYGIFTGDGDLNPYGIGIGVNGGYTLDMGLFVGAQFDYFFGGSESQELLGIETEVNVNVYDLMGVVGYDLGLSPGFVLRPQAGLGLTFASGEVCIADECESGDTESNFTIAPGVKALYNIGGDFEDGGLFLSGEAAYHKVFTSEDDGEGDADAFVLGIGAGASF